MMTCKGFAFLFVSMTCQPTGAPPDTYCQIAKPVYWSRADSAETKWQIKRENAKWMKLCGGRK